MFKYIYRTIVLLVVFAVALFIFGSQLKSEIHNEGEKVVVGSESLPYMTLNSQGQEMNILYGYNGPLDSDIVRESITPIDNSRTIKVSFKGGDIGIVKLQYDVIDKNTEEVLYTNTLNSMPKENVPLDILLDYHFMTSTEYILSFTAVTDQGRKVHYFTRLKYYQENSNLAGKVKFVMDFHENTFSKGKQEEIAKYLETDGSVADNNLAHVTIKSGSEIVTWGKLSPNKLSSVVPTIKEYNMETACVELSYFVEGNTNTGKQKFRVNEFYRIRYAHGKAYLLNFDRTMNAMFDPKMTKANSGLLKIGITPESGAGVMASPNTKEVYFVHDANLYCYSMDKKVNKIRKIYSAFSEKVQYEYMLESVQNIRLLDVDDNGDLTFVAYGYFPRGQYEGKVAIILYKYDREDGILNELIYLPIDTTYQQLNQDFMNYSYISEKNIYYFAIGNNVYSYNIEARRLVKIVEGVTDKGFKVIEANHCFVWSSDPKAGYGDNITVFDLDTEKKTIIEKKGSEEYIRLMGVINEDIVYGYVKKDDISTTKAGTPLIPCYEMDIANKDGKVSKCYNKAGRYITEVKSEGNVMTLYSAKKIGKGRFKTVSDDSILNQNKEKGSAYYMKSGASSMSLTEWYIGFPAGFVFEKTPDYEVAEDVTITVGKAVHLGESSSEKYYVYAFGRITGAYESPAEAIKVADSQMGVVISNSHRIVWERSGSFLKNSVAGIEMIKVQNRVSNSAACAAMVLKANHFNVNPENMTERNNTMLQMLKTYMSEPVDLTGLTLEQALYFVSNSKYVIAVINNNRQVVISGYDTKTVTYYDPVEGKVKTTSRDGFEKSLKNSGRVMVSYL
ncbi:hypothetical protein [Eubacterium xylanophilum]|uniref:hypothetical protein n=1 Tax=Eubacterium xylanophilum TaxID=39497 RepID=UPI000478C24B|nr:hypothetical protein [Eubacterium xylanophilum]